MIVFFDHKRRGTLEFRGSLNIHHAVCLYTYLQELSESETMEPTLKYGLRNLLHFRDVLAEAIGATNFAKLWAKAEDDEVSI